MTSDKEQCVLARSLIGIPFDVSGKVALASNRVGIIDRSMRVVCAVRNQWTQLNEFPYKVYYNPYNAMRSMRAMMELWTLTFSVIT